MRNVQGHGGEVQEGNRYNQQVGQASCIFLTFLPAARQKGP